MQAVINSLTFKGPIQDELIQKVEQDFKPRAQELAGLHSFYLVRTAPNQACLVLVYDSLSALEEGTRTLGSPWFEANVAPYLAAAPQRSVGEVPVAIENR